LFAVIFVGGFMVANNDLVIEYFVAFYSYVGQFSGSISNISKFNLNIQKVMNTIERIFHLLDGLNYKTEKFGDKGFDIINGKINLENVTFSYDEKGIALDNITIDIPAKSRVAFVGCSGSGKSTIFNLVLRFYDTYNGRIAIDDVDIKEITENDLRRNISIVLQNPTLFNMSIKENLLLANAEASQHEIEDTCKKAYIHDYIESLPKKYDTVIGENGITLSGGQKQRIAIARALLKKSKIILFDEATASLDNESQFYIKKAIDDLTKDCTVVIIAHRLSTIIESNIIYVIDKGKIVGKGDHQTLIQNNYQYKKLYKAEVQLIQNKSEKAV
jgi:ATP-binding cassette subfamily B protein